MSRYRSEAVLLALCVSLLGAACVDSGDPGVRTERAKADIVFGVPEAEDAELAVYTPPPVAPVGQPAMQTLRVPFRNQLPDRFSNVAFSVTPEQADAAACESAPLGAAPDELAGRNASEPPVEGLYRYKISGTQTLTINNGQPITTPLTGFQPRIVQNVEIISDTSWRFETVEPLGDGARITTWIVNTDPEEVVDPTSSDTDGDGIPDGRGIKPPYVGENPVRAGEPARGIAIESYEDFDENGNPSGSFDAIPALLHMPLPVLPGESYQAQAVDRQGQFIQIDGEVLDRETVDACGELVDGWKVTQSVTSAQSADSSVNDVEWIFSTPMGGLPVSQRVQQTQSDPTTGTEISYDITYRIGQLEPSPIPGADG